MTVSLTVPDQSSTGTRTLDAAKGILVGLRRCSLNEAFDEILIVAAQHHVGPLAVSRALIELTEGRSSGYATAAEEAAHRAWTTLVERS